MKILGALAVLVLTSSCGKIASVGSGSLGGSMDMSQVSLTTRDVTVLKKICDSFQRKTAAISADPGATYRFAVSSRGCDETSMSAESVVDTTVEQNGSNYKFKRTDNNSYFVFPDVETADSGIMKEICENTANPVSPIVNTAGVAISFDVVDVPGCPSGVGECIRIQKAILTSSSTTDYKIVTDEIVKFQTELTLPKYGFFTYRSIKASSSCSAGKTSENRAILK